MIDLQEKIDKVLDKRILDRYTITTVAHPKSALYYKFVVIEKSTNSTIFDTTYYTDEDLNSRENYLQELLSIITSGLLSRPLTRVVNSEKRVFGPAREKPAKNTAEKPEKPEKKPRKGRKNQK